jgi:hypothetical protein
VLSLDEVIGDIFMDFLMMLILLLAWWLLFFHASRLCYGAPMIMWIADNTCWCMTPLTKRPSTLGLSWHCIYIFIWLASLRHRVFGIYPLFAYGWLLWWVGISMVGGSLF